MDQAIKSKAKSGSNMAWCKKMCKRKSTKSRMALRKQSRQGAEALLNRQSRQARRYARLGVNAGRPAGTV